jgi:hypothetical protein
VVGAVGGKQRADNSCRQTALRVTLGTRSRASELHRRGDPERDQPIGKCRLGKGDVWHTSAWR